MILKALEVAQNCLDGASHDNDSNNNSEDLCPGDREVLIHLPSHGEDRIMSIFLKNRKQRAHNL